MLFTGIFFPGKFSFGPKTLKLQISFMGVRKFIKLFVLEKYTTKLLRILNGLSFMRAIKGAAVQFYRQHSQKGYTKPQSYTVYICIQALTENTVYKQALTENTVYIYRHLQKIQYIFIGTYRKYTVYPIIAACYILSFMISHNTFHTVLIRPHLLKVIVSQDFLIL